jgi:hypothetical protein
MAEQSEVQVQDLFKHWRNGDADAGQIMARRFNDWYYAVATSRLGFTEARPALEQACAAFVEGISTVSRANDVVDWAHSVLSRYVHQESGRIAGGDFKNALTGDRSPVRLLQQVRPTLDNSHARLLCMAYSAEVTDLDLEQAAEATDAGWPMALLDARYALKRSLRDNLQVGFSVVPIQPDLDCAPLPLYESNRMSTGDEEALFEKWLITNEELCRDLAEFATFAHALRTGAMQAPTQTDRLKPRRARGSVFDEIRPHSNRRPRLALALTIGGVLAILAILVYLLYFFQGLS